MVGNDARSWADEEDSLVSSTFLSMNRNEALKRVRCTIRVDCDGCESSEPSVEKVEIKAHNTREVVPLLEWHQRCTYSRLVQEQAHCFVSVSHARCGGS